jgi:tripartite-type tricarboxylate transporter receptor subunit TctC
MIKSLRFPARLACTMAVAFAAVFAGAASAQTYPAKTVRMIVPYAPGGAPDTLARLLGQRLTETMGQQFVVENRPGAGGISAAETSAKSPADGYTVFFSDIQQLAINPYMFSKLPYDPAKDFAPVMLTGSIPLFIVAQSSLGISTLKELVAYAKANPGKLTYGSAGIGSIHHITMESMKAALGLDIVHVPYKGTGQAVPAFMGGEVSLVVSAYPALAAHVKSGKAKFVAITSSNRMPQAPEAAPVAEMVPGFNFSSELGVVVPAGTPPAIVSRLNAEFGKALQNPEVNQKLTAMGFVLISSSSDAYAENIRSNLQVFAKAVKISGAKAE